MALANSTVLGSLVTPQEMSQKIKEFISAERLIELAEAGLVPHYTIENKIFFGVSETKKWLSENLVMQHQGKNIGNQQAMIINVVSPKLQCIDIPVELRAIAAYLIPMELQSVESCQMSGIYFLCDQGTVVYVGQSVNVLSRVGSHFGSKTFDFAFLLRVPKSDLNYVEGQFIRAMKPKYNWSIGNRLVAPTEECFECRESEVFVGLIKEYTRKV